MSIKHGFGFVFSVGWAVFVGFLFGYFQWRAGAISSGYATGAGMILGAAVLMILWPIVNGILSIP